MASAVKGRWAARRSEASFDEFPAVTRVGNATVTRAPLAVEGADAVVGRDKPAECTSQAEGGALLFESPLLQRRYGGVSNITRARALLQNDAVAHAMHMMKSESARVDAKLLADFDEVLAGQCVYLPAFFCSAKDTQLYEQLQQELLAYVRQERPAATLGTVEESEAAGRDAQEKKLKPSVADETESLRKAWSKHQIFENPESISETFTAVIAALAEYFSVEVYATRLNYYKDGSHWKPYHHDSHAYGGRALREDFTMGVSLGATRSLSFLHEPSSRIFEFPQVNGDVFAFTNEVNTRFMHGVPKSSTSVGERLSVIAWGRRREINPRNGGAIARGGGGGTNDVVAGAVSRPLRCVDDAISAAQQLVSVRVRAEAPPARNDACAGDEDLAPTAGTKPDAAAAKKKKKNRLQ